MSTLTLLGPQRMRPTLAATLDRLSVTGQVAVVTAGWQEREGEIDEMREHMDRPVVDLRLHRRLDQVFAEDPALFHGHRARQDRLQEMHRLYRYRLDFMLQPARELLRREGPSELLEPEREAAIEAARHLDQAYLGRIAEVHRAFEREHAPGSHPALEAQRTEVAEILDGSAVLCIAGGHVAALLNRLRLFRIAELVHAKPIIAWSAGAMALADRIVLFHDSPPQGFGNAEVLDLGLGLYSGAIPLPHASRRLRFEDPHRVALFARRFAPDACLLLDDGDAMTLEGQESPGWRAFGTSPARRLTTDGQVRELAA